MEKLRGVNLGNWLVLEKWMEPALFEGSGAEDEVTLARKLSPEALAALLKAHRDSYVTEDDFRHMAALGLNAVRLPVPCIVFGDRPPVPGCVEYVDRAFDWAEKHGLGVLLDLHTVPGSQNGYDNGGIIGVCKWHRSPADVEFALTVLERLARRYGRRKGLYGIEVLNEPIGPLAWLTSPARGRAADRGEAKGSGPVPMRFLRAFYVEAYARLRKYLPEEKVIVFHDGFRLSRWSRFFEDRAMVNVRLDAHAYIFPIEVLPPLSRPWLYRLYLGLWRRWIVRAQRTVPVIIGEWSLGCRYPNAGRPDPRTRGERFSAVARLQLDAWRETDGWFFWSYRLRRDAEAPVDRPWKDGWDLSRCAKNGWLPPELLKGEGKAP